MFTKIKNTIQKNKYESLAFFLFLILVMIRIINIGSITLEYDEIWTLRNYAMASFTKIFTDVATPNNHVLNSFCIKLSMELFGFSLPVMRLPALLPFIGLAILLFRSSFRFLQNSAIRAAVIVLILFDGLLLHYAEVARGYSMQTFFIFGMFLALLSMEYGRNTRLAAIGWLVCATGSCLTISSGILFVTFMTFLWWLMITPFRSGIKGILEKEKFWILCGVLFFLFVLLWYGGNFKAFAAGRSSFGEVFTSAGQYFRYLWRTLSESLLIIPLLISASAAIFLKGREKKILITACGTILLMLLSALVTKGGPVRIYLPLIPVAWFAAAVAADHLLLPVKRKQIFFLIFVLVLGSSLLCSETRREHFADVDLGIVFSELKQLDPSTLIVYRPTDAYVIANVFGKTAREDFAQRLQSPSTLLLTGTNAIGVMRFQDFSTAFIAPGGKMVSKTKMNGKFSCWMYRLRKIRSGEDLRGKAVFCILHGQIPELHTPHNWLKDHFSCVNSFLNPVKGMYPSYLFAAEGKDLNSAELLAIETQRPGTVSFYIPAN